MCRHWNDLPEAWAWIASLLGWAWSQAFARKFIFLILLPVATFGADSAQLNLTAAQNYRLFSAVRTQDQAAMVEAIRAGANVNARGKHAITPLMLAVDLGHLPAVVELLASHANPNDKADDGASPVSLAAVGYKRHPDILTAVMKGGGDPNILLPNGDPVVNHFVDLRNCEYIRLMKSFGANLDAATRTRDPLIIGAALADDWDAVLCLIQAGANFRHQDGRYPLSKILAERYPGPGSPMYPYKQQVWQHLRSNGIAVQPLE